MKHDRPEKPPTDLLDRIAKATRLREGREGVAAVLRIAYRQGPLPLRDLAVAVRMPLPVVSAVRRELEKAELLRREGGVRLSPAGRRFAEQRLGLGAKFDPTCRGCSGLGTVIDPSLENVLEALRAHSARGPTVDVTLDQAPCTPETALRRALAMYQAGAVEGREIVFVGDDDSISVAVGLLCAHLGTGARRLTVLDIDRRRLDHLADACKRHELDDVELVEHDVRSPLPNPLRESFDVFQTDPPYTLDGMTLFVSRGVEALREGGGSRAFLSFADLAPDDALDFEQRLVDMGLAVIEVRPSFNRYEGASILGSVGQLMSLVTTSRTRSLADEGSFDRPIFTGEVRPRNPRYRCTTCLHVTGVGAGETVATIEELKGRGCPKCRSSTFRRVRAEVGRAVDEARRQRRTGKPRPDGQ